jgi:hypothetical protein
MGSLKEYVLQKMRSGYEAQVARRHGGMPDHDNPHFVQEAARLILNVARTEAEASKAMDAVLGEVQYDGPHKVGPDTQQAGYAGNASVIYVKTYSALALARDCKRMRQIIKSGIEKH